ncbi:MAG: TIGR04255 family protein [Chloroflexi bacterium]|nr:TIGR04255 family protein [Chloroflexota bacterium]
MPFPASEREVYAKNVLKEVICQLRFPPILRIKGQTPFEFQNAIRNEYPMYEEESPQDLLPPEIASLASGLSVRLGSADTIHKFAVADGHRTISLASTFFALSETKYVDRDKFREAVAVAERAFRAEYDPSFYSRLGVRYKNVIDRSELGIESQPWHSLLNKQLLAELGADDNDIKDDVTAIITKSEMRVADIPGSQVRITHGLAKNELGKDVYFLDADFYTSHQWREEEDVSRIIEVFSDLNGRFFRWAISDQLKDVLRARDESTEP